MIIPFVKGDITIVGDPKSLIKNHIEQTKGYILTELRVLEEVNSYDIIYDYLRQLPGRIRKFVNDRTKRLEDELLKGIYLSTVSEEVKKVASNYSPMDGSVPQDIGDTLKKLADEFSSKV